MDILTRKDELIMLSILKLEEDASLNNIRAYLNKKTFKKWSIGNVFVSLEKLENVKLIENKLGDPQKKRGGKAVKFYVVTKHGMDALKETRKIQDNLWDGLYDMVFGG